MALMKGQKKYDPSQALSQRYVGITDGRKVNSENVGFSSMT